MTGLGSTLGSYHSEADHWTSNLTSLRLSLLICKMGTLGAAARIQWGEVANSVVTQFFTWFLGKVLDCNRERQTPGPPGQQTEQRLGWWCFSGGLTSHEFKTSRGCRHSF